MNIPDPSIMQSLTHISNVLSFMFTDKVPLAMVMQNWLLNCHVVTTIFIRGVPST